jgi:mannose-6-phosphate isomerase-like protein (cupin superfamily)
MPVREMMAKTVSHVARQHGQGESFWVLGDHYRVKISADETKGSLAVIEVIAFPENGPPPHIHHREDESFYILDGTFSVLIGDQRFGGGAGDFVHIPRGTLHTYENIGVTPGRLLVTLTPGGFENLWREIGESAQQDCEPPPPSEGTIAKLMALAPRYQLEIPPPTSD